MSALVLGRTIPYKIRSMFKLINEFLRNQIWTCCDTLLIRRGSALVLRQNDPYKIRCMFKPIIQIFFGELNFDLLRYFINPKGVGLSLKAEQPLQDKLEEQNEKKKRKRRAIT